jgi:hypothetical protein
MMAPGTQGEVSPKSIGKTVSSAVGNPPDAKPATSATTKEHCGTKSAKALHRKPIELSIDSELKVKKEIPV